MKKSAVLMLVAGFIALLAGYQVRQLISTPSAQTQKLTLPPFTLTGLDGKEHAINEWQNKTLIINFWATWCPPCLKEMPAFNALNKEYAEKGVQFIGIALDEAEATQEFVYKNGITYPILLGGDNGINLAQKLGNLMNTVPFTVFVDKSGYIVKTHMGELDRTKLIEIIHTIL